MINPKINDEFTTQRRRSGISLTLDTSSEIDESVYILNKLKPPGTPRKKPLTYFQKIMCCWYK